MLVGEEDHGLWLSARKSSVGVEKCGCTREKWCESVDVDMTNMSKPELA